jgi:AcrR family transcriptional regulator
VARMSAGERRAALVEAAISVMKRRGVANTSTRDIVAEAGMQIGVFHYCFESKEQLVREVMRAINERTNTAVGEGLADVEPGPAFIHAAVEAYWEHIKSDPNEHLLTYELTTHALRNLRAEDSGDDADVVTQIQRRRAGDGGLDAAVSQYRHYLFTMEALLMMLADVCTTKWTTPVAELARVTLASTEGITLQWLVDGDDACAQRSFSLVADTLARDANLV